MPQAETIKSLLLITPGTLLFMGVVLLDRSTAFFMLTAMLPICFLIMFVVGVISLFLGI